MDYRKIIIILLFVSLVLTSCHINLGGYDIDETYSVLTIDIDEDAALYYNLPNGSSIGRVGARVVAVGWNENHIIVERHQDADPRLVQFYILDKRKDEPLASPEVAVTGPLDSAGFETEKGRLGILSLSFTKRFD